MAEWGVVVVTVGKPKVQHSQVTYQYFYVTEKLAFGRHWLKHSKNILCNIRMIIGTEKAPRGVKYVVIVFRVKSQN